jgi:hypothetical protein
MLIFGVCLTYHPKWISSIGTLLEADTVPSKTHFWYGCPYGYSVGDSRINLVDKPETSDKSVQLVCICEYSNSCEQKYLIACISGYIDYLHEADTWAIACALHLWG